VRLGSRHVDQIGLLACGQSQPNLPATRTTRHSQLHPSSSSVLTASQCRSNQPEPESGHERKTHAGLHNSVTGVDQPTPDIDAFFAATSSATRELDRDAGRCRDANRRLSRDAFLPANPASHRPSSTIPGIVRCCVEWIGRPLFHWLQQNCGGSCLQDSLLQWLSAALLFVDEGTVIAK
jgi:hypothetical protein